MSKMNKFNNFKIWKCLKSEKLFKKKFVFEILGNAKSEVFKINPIEDKNLKFSNVKKRENVQKWHIQNKKTIKDNLKYLPPPPLQKIR